MIGQTVSHYKILEKLGEGGMGVVYKALDTRLDRHVAIKFLPPHLRTDKDAKSRFVHEAKAASALNHANIAVVHEIDETPEGQMFIVMACYEGPTLKKRLKNGALDVDDAIAIVSQVASGLSEAHEKDILHRDIKPANILFGADGQAKLADFGLAKLAGRTQVTKTGTTVGTVSYMSPEQASGGDVDHRSDIFSLGVVLYELLTGKLPFPGGHEAAVMYGIINNDPAPLTGHIPALPPELQHVVEKALCKDVNARYQTVSEFLADVAGISSGLGVISAAARPRRGIGLGLTGLILVIAIIVAGYAGYRQLSQSRHPSVAPEASKLVTIAVLPFVNMSSDAEQEYFSDGLTEEVTNVLVKIPELRVTGRTSSFSFKGKDEDRRTIGEQLDVEYILEGSVRKSGNKIRITAKLVKVEDGFQLWSKNYNQTTLDDVFEAQEEIAESVAQVLEVTLLDRENGEAKRPGGLVYDLVLQARFVMREERTAESTRRAREIMERALAIDPDFAPAWAEMGFVHEREMLSDTTMATRQETLEAVREALQTAISLDPGMALAHARMATGYYLEVWDFESARRSIERALELDPRHPIVVGNAAYLARAMGRFDEAVVLDEQWLKTEPLYKGAYINLAHSYRGAGRLQDAEDTCLKAQKLWPDGLLGMLARIYLSAGRVEEARTAWSRSVEIEGASDRIALFLDALIDHSAGDDKAAYKALAEFESNYGSDNPTSCARIRAWRGETDAAFEWLEKAFAASDPSLAYLKQHIELRSLYSDRRWNTLLEKIGLPMK